ncbi:MAG: glycolate oxidase subunit GlcF [Gammaproteobacteria bacterium]
MKTHLHAEFAGLPEAAEARAIVGKCVHCGFCNATCPTYLELGDERDGPRGRIYLIRQLLETGQASANSRRHLDRCLTCRACETTCPSGVEYGRLVDIGREALETRTPRSIADRILRRALRLIVPHRRRFGALLRIGQALRPILPRTLQRKVPLPQRRLPAAPTTHLRRVVLLDGCAQAAATPATNDAAARVLDRLGITVMRVAQAGCCGAVSYHLSAHDEARRFMRRNIDALLPAVEAGAEHIVSSASGCGVLLRDYGEILRDDPDYAEPAARISALTVDLCELLHGEDLAPLRRAQDSPVALHLPCTLTHGLRRSDMLRDVLERCGLQLAATRDDHLCCGSAGTYSVLQPEMSGRLLDNKLAALSLDQPTCIATANVGCQLHLATRAEVPVRHWIELLDTPEKSAPDL